MRAPPVEAEQHGSIRIQDLTKVIMAWRRLGLTEERLVHLKLRGTSRTPMIVHVRFIAFSAVGLTLFAPTRIRFMRPPQRTRKADRTRPKRHGTSA